MPSDRIRLAAVAVLGAWLMGTAGRASSAEPLVTEAIINAPVSEVWRVLTTPDGWRLMGVAHVEIDLAIGGEIRSHYDPAGALGDPNTIVNEILAYDPGRMLAIRVKQAPASFEHRDAVDATWSVFYLYPLGEEMTNLQVVGLGYGDDAASQQMRKHFEAGNRWTLDRIVSHYAPKFARCEAEEQDGTR